MSVGTQTPVLKPLKIKCTRTDCTNDLHCFLQKTQKPRPHGGPCRACGRDLIDFSRIQARDLGDLDNTFDSLSKEWIRHHFWECSFDQHAINHARRKGKAAFRESEAQKRIRQSVGKARHPMEGKQTPFERNVLFYAQHAVAACCRKCIQYWHGIPMGRPLDENEITYLARLVFRYVDKRLPDLNEHPMKVPPIRKTKAAQSAGRIGLAKGRADGASADRPKARHG